ncbi:hypothetical protein PUMCH_001873 [Australozyma saopauloensis]|uniref:Oligomycin resistance ATP-dependent permease YOR1 n=1 Tax=Australozyma saopauloensis TaxID=291208 RepID=A0AAX4H8M1_9ASCO|nr:hypothetical protein PUMCH_001873 [[Candida] saopauloensis]
MNNVKPQKRLLTPFLLKKVPPVPEENERRQFPRRVNIFSKVFFWWVLPVMSVGYKRTVVEQDMFVLTDDLKVETIAARFEANLAAMVLKYRAKHIALKAKQRAALEATGAHAAPAVKAEGKDASIEPESSASDTSNLSSKDRDLMDPEKDFDDFKLPKYIVGYALLQTFAFQYGLACFFLMLSGVASTCTPLLTRKLITYVELKALGLEESVGQGVGMAIGSALLVGTIGILFNHSFQFSMMTGAQVKAVLTKALLDKSFRLSGKARLEFPTSRITSIMGTDLARVDMALGFQPFILTFPVTMAISIGILCHYIGAPAMVGVGLAFVFLILTMLFTAKLFMYRRSANFFTDGRVKYVKEVLNNLKMIKYYTWEEPYFDRIKDCRDKEMKIIYTMQVARNLIIAVFSSLTSFASLSSFLVLYATGARKTENPATIFASLSLFNVLSQQVFMLPIALATASDAIIGVARSGEVLSAEEIDPEATATEASPEVKALMDAEGLAIRVQNASFAWEAKNPVALDTSSADKVDSADPSTEEKVAENESLEAISISQLKSISLSVKKGEFVAITGLIGSGKSSLLNALAGFMKRTNGNVSVNGNLLMCGAPWVQNTTVKDNIVFGNELLEQKYKDVIYACSLESDVEILPAGDQTEIGERGITLSGGQKARINLARAVYADNDIILLDDVLSAVDARVGKHIMKYCLMGLLKEKTRILATHQLSLIGTADRVIFMNGDGTIDFGTITELKERSDGFRTLMAYNAEHEKKENEDAEETVEDTVEEDREFIVKQLSRQPTVRDEEEEHHNYQVNEDQDGKLIDEERKAENKIKWTVYKNFIKYGSGIFKHYTSVPIIVLITILAVFCQLFTNTWLSFWTERKFPDRSNGFYIGIYVMFTFIAFFLLCAEFWLVAYIVNEAAVSLNVKAVKRVLRVPMSYMDTTPMGRVLNRFTKDTDVIDNEIGTQLRMLIYFISTIIGILVLCVIYLPWFALAIPPLGAIFIAVANYYQASAREVKRLEATQRSLVYNNFNETLSGMDTLKALKKEDMFLDKNSRLINKMNEAYYFTIANQRWLAIQLDMVACVMVLLVAFLCVFRVFRITAASVGLLLSYILQIASQLSMVVRMYTQVENEMNSVERVCEYAFDLPQEAPEVITETTPRPTWPEQGMIRFENASLAYRPGLPLVLNKLNMDVRPAEKIGICGRTGAGKSSIMTALFRLAELSEGTIEIDGVDIATLGLKSLRSQLSIIPQDPVLFAGTVRKNLDPFDSSTDEELWNALARAGLIEREQLEFVKTQDPNSEDLHKFHLSRTVEDDGINFSLGERQLISFARALVRGSKILILDEATSSVDYETDSKIQDTIVREFSHCTILCIAHRLKTIINYDRIVVLDKGKIVEFDTPLNLFKSRGSIFQQMCEKSNIAESDFRLH